MTLTAEDMSGIREMVEDVITRRVDPRFAQVDARFDRVDARFDQVDARFGRIEEELGALRSNLDGVSADVRILRQDMAGVKVLVKDHSLELAKLRHRTA